MSFIYDSMRPYQRTGARFGRAAGNFLLADQPGLGKTIQTLGSIIAYSAKHPSGTEWHLILCPKVAVHAVWAAEIVRWLPDFEVEVLELTGPNKGREKALREFRPKSTTNHVFIISNIEAVRRGSVPALWETGWNTVVVDESHRALIRRSVKSESLVRQGCMVVGKNARRRIALSGTPMRGKPQQLWGTLNWLWPDVYTSYWAWAEEYWHIMSDGFSDYVLGEHRRNGLKQLQKDHAKIICRRTKAEVAPDLPPKGYAGSHLIPGDPNSPFGVWLDPTPWQKRQDKSLIEEAMVTDKDGNELITNGQLAIGTRRRQVAGGYHTIQGETGFLPTIDSPKFEWLLEWLEQADGEKVVVASQFTKTINCFAAALQTMGYTVGCITGDTKDSERSRVVERFQNSNDIQIVMLNTNAGGVALTLDAADYLVLLDETFIPDDQEQVEDRIHRVSRNHNVTIYYLRTLGTVDEEVAWVAAARQNVQQYILDGARGVQYARELYLQNQKTKESRK